MDVFEALFKYPWREFARGSVKVGFLRPEVALAAVVVVVIAAVYFYRRVPESVPRRMRTLLSVLRALALGVLAIILFQPVLEIAMPVTRDCFVAVLVDDSRSMRIEDAGQQGALTEKGRRRSRLAAAKDLLGTVGQGNPSDKPGLLEHLSEVAPVRVFKFSAEAERVNGVNDITGGGDRTNLYNALKVVETELRGVPVVGVVMLTDGSANAGGAPQEMARALLERGVPVYCVGFGDPSPPNDYEVMRVQAPRQVNANTNVEIYASVRATGFPQPFAVGLSEGDKTLQTVTITPQAGVEVYRVPFAFKPENKGTFRFTVTIPPAEDEVIVDNNRGEFLVTVEDKRLPVLYLEGSPREEYRFLRRALFRDKDFRIASILRVEGPKKYILQGAEPEDGLVESDPAKREAHNGYPTTKEHLYGFEAVIFGDIEAGYLTPKQLEITEQFVKERGGGFLMLGGVNSFNLGKYHGTVIDKMLPVVLPPASVGYQQREFNIVLTQAGEEHPVMMQSSNVLFNRNIWSKAPTLIGLNPITEVKPGALVLAAEPRTNDPVVVVQQYGAGRSAAFTTGGSWHWRMAVSIEDELHERFWKQLVRWLAVGSKARISIEMDKDLFARKEPVAIRTVVLDPTMAPINDATVLARVEDPFGNKQELPQEWILSREGVYQTQYEPLEAGDYKVEVEATLKDGKKISATASFSVGETLDEFNDAGQKQALLEDVGRITGGKYLPPDQANELADALKSRVRQMKREETFYERHDIWDTPLWFGLLAVALSLEWFLRRRSGLM